DRGDDGIDDEGADVEDGGGQQAGYQGEACEGDGQRAVGAPDELDGAAAVAEDAEEAAEGELVGGGGRGMAESLGTCGGWHSGIRLGHWAGKPMGRLGLGGGSEPRAAWSPRRSKPRAAWSPSASQNA